MRITYKVEEFLKRKLDQINFNHGSDGDLIYNDLYKDVNSESLRSIFSVLHNRLNNLFSLLNDRNTPGYGGSFNADPSRSLIDLIDTINILKANVKESDYNFIFDSYYEEILRSCRLFLKSRNGSPIPREFLIIDLIESKSIFSLIKFTEFQGPHQTSSFLIEEIGGGSYATVFKYFDTHYNRFFAIKKAHVNLREDELVRFKNEYNELHNLSSPFIVEVYNFNEKNLEYTMEFADFTLEDYITDNNANLTMSQRILLVRQLLRAFIYIHQKDGGILHRDVSYTNVLIKEYDDKTIFVKVSDLGLLKKPGSKLTREGTEVKGILNDTSLELIGFENYEVRHETYALTRLINFILTGKTTGLIELEHVKEFILRGISNNINLRFSSVQELNDEFKKVVPFLKLL